MHRVTAAVVATVATVATLVAVATATTPPTPIIAPAKTLDALYSHLNATAYEQCLNGTTCFFFIPEAPFTRIDADADSKNRESSLDPRRLFPCIEYAERGLGGIGFKVHELIPNNTDMCAMLDPTDGWTFNMLIQMLHNTTLDPTHPGYGMGLGASGAWVPTEWRADKATASDSYMEDPVVVVRRTSAEGFRAPKAIDFPALLRPFAKDTWLLLGGSAAAVIIVVAFLAIWQPTPIHWRRGRLLRLLQWTSNFVRILVGGELRGQERHFAPARTLLLGTIVVCAAIFALFYEAALILNAIPNTLDSLVSGLSDDEMCRWTVVRGAATEEIFVGLVNAGRGSGAKVSIQSRTWSTCNSVPECIQQVVNGTVSNEPRCAGKRTEVFVSWRMIILAEFGSQRSLCDELEVVNADGSGSFSRFNLGWHFADVNPLADGAGDLLPLLARRRQEINAAFRREHLSKNIQRIVEQEVGQELQCTGTPQQVHVGLLVAPIFVVLLVGLTLAIVATVAVPVLHRALMNGVSAEQAAADAVAAETWAAEAAMAEAMAANLPPPPPPRGRARRRRGGHA